MRRLRGRASDAKETHRRALLLEGAQALPTLAIAGRAALDDPQRASQGRRTHRSSARSDWGHAWPIAPRINVKGAIWGAEFRRPQIINGDERAGFITRQPLPVSDAWKYRGKTVMLIDERAISQSEHTALFFEMAAGTKFVGTRTPGANGDVTNLVVPGGIFMSFSGHDVRHADGRQLQRIGIVPDIEVIPTLAGIRAHKDEVLERALRYVKDGR
ncbi:MAG TPA: S41 family peptidase [Polyangia bacterium]|nr:S41 family peptidase [Polyangia bacterium]